MIVVGVVLSLLVIIIAMGGAILVLFILNRAKLNGKNRYKLYQHLTTLNSRECSIEYRQPQQAFNMEDVNGTASPVELSLSKDAAESQTVVYAETMASVPRNTTLSPATEHYAVLAVSGASTGKPPENDPLKVIYSEVDPKSQVARSKKISIKQTTPIHQGEFTVVVYQLDCTSVVLVWRSTGGDIYYLNCP